MTEEPDWLVLVQEVSAHFGTQPRLSLPGPMRMSGRDRRSWSWPAVNLVIDHVDGQRGSNDPTWHVTVELVAKTTHEYVTNQDLDLDAVHRFLELVGILPGPCNWQDAGSVRLPATVTALLQLIDKWHESGFAIPVAVLDAADAVKWGARHQDDNSQ